jgi:hypothetical protein
MTTGDLLTLLLGGGAVATIGALFKGLQALQTGARARERETVKSLVEQRNEAWEDRDFLTDERDYWRNRSGTVEFHSHREGVSLPDLGKPPERKKRDEEEEK